MSAASLCVLEQLMTAQAQECVFEGLSLPAPAAPHDCLAQLRLAQEAAQVRTGTPVPSETRTGALPAPPPPAGGQGAWNEGLGGVQWLRLLLVPGPWGAGRDPRS